MATEILRPGDLDWSRTNPCADCPFLRTSPFHEGVASGIGTLIDALEANALAHTCHKTDNRQSVDGPRNFPGKTQHCAGLILMLLKTGDGRDLQLPLLRAMERGDLDIARMTEKAERDTEVYTLVEFLTFYGNELRRVQAQFAAQQEAE